MNLSGRAVDVRFRSHCIRTALASALILVSAGCSGGSDSSPTVPSAATRSVQRVTGTLAIAVTGASSSFARSRGTRGPDFVSAFTKHAALFIDQSATAAGSTTSCTSSSCTISWSASLTVPASHVFSVEVDDSTYVLGEGQAAYTIVPGENSLATLSLNGVLGFIDASPGTCSSSSNSCTFFISTDDYDDEIVATSSTTVTPVFGTPTSGDVFDNYNGTNSKNLTITSNSSPVGMVTGTSASPYASYASGTFTILGLSPTGAYTPTVACVAGATGSFGVTFGTGTPSGDVTPSELSGLSLTYPTIVGRNLTNLFSCNGGTISETIAATGTLPVN